MIEQYITNLSALVTPSLTLWFAVWAYRYNYKLDEKLDPAAKQIRWSIVTAAYAVAAIPMAFTWMIFIRPPIALLGLGFLVWPNLAFRLAKLIAAEDHPQR